MAPAHAHDLDTSNLRPARHLNSVPPIEPERRLRPGRLNAAGVCVYCLQPCCKSGRCIAQHRLSTWELCNRCDGTSYDHVQEDNCNCTSGLVETTDSITLPRIPLRPSRLNFAGFCIWCLGHGCEAPRCLGLHSASTWGTCPDCHGLGLREDVIEACFCYGGLIEVIPPEKGAR